MHIASPTAKSHSDLQVKLFTEAFTDKVPIMSTLRASTKAELEEAKQKLVSGLKASEPHVVHTCGLKKASRPPETIAWAL